MNELAKSPGDCRPEATHNMCFRLKILLLKIGSRGNPKMHLTVFLALLKFDRPCLKMKRFKF